MKSASRLRPDLQVLCYLDTLTYTERRRLPLVVPYWYTLAMVQAKAQPNKRVIQYAPIAESRVAA